MTHISNTIEINRPVPGSPIKSRDDDRENMLLSRRQFPSYLWNARLLAYVVRILPAICALGYGLSGIVRCGRSLEIERLSADVDISMGRLRANAFEGPTIGEVWFSRGALRGRRVEQSILSSPLRLCVFARECPFCELKGPVVSLSLNALALWGGSIVVDDLQRNLYLLPYFSWRAFSPQVVPVGVS